MPTTPLAIPVEMQKPEAKLTHMPRIIKQMITDSVKNVGTTLAISQMSKEFLALAKDSPTTLEKVTVQIAVDKLTVIKEARFLKPVPDCYSQENSDPKKLVMEFSTHEDGVLMKNPTSNWQKILPERDYRKAGVQYLLGTIGSKSTIKEFVLEVREPGNRPAAYPKAQFEEDRKVIMDEFERLLRGFNHQLLVQSISFNIEVTEQQILKTLSYLQSGTLYHICLSHNSPEIMPRRQNVLDIERISETKQWKEASHLKITGYTCDFTSEKFAHFQDLQVHWTVAQKTLKAVIEIFFNRPKLESLYVTSYRVFDYTGVKEYLREFNPTKLKCRSDEMTVKMSLPNEPNTTINMSISSFEIFLTRSF